MKSKKNTVLSLVLALAMALSLAACAAGPKTAGASAESADVGDLALRPEGEAGHIYKNGDYNLLVPLEYDELVTVDTESGAEEGTLFTVSEKASVEAAEADGATDPQDGWGWLFSVARIGADELHEMLCYDMSNAYVFARDSADQYFMIYHPSDVRLYRQGDAYQDAMEQWTALNEWAATAAETFLAENADLEAFERGNSMLDMYLARAAYQGGANYTLSTTEYGPMAPNGVEAAPYAERLMTGVDVSYESVEPSETPDGEYVVLSFPEENMRFDFFVGEGGNYVREVWYDGRENLMKAVFADGTTTANGIAQEWYDALVAANEGDTGNAALGYTPDDLVGRWAEKIAGRGVITVAKAAEDGKYDVTVEWANSAFEQSYWEMQAVAGNGGVLTYENGKCAIRTYDSDGKYTEDVRYENGSGTLYLNSAFEVMWEDNIDGAGDNAVFVSVD